MTGEQTDEFMILGPSMAARVKVLEAVHALYYLPENFTLLLTSGKNTDQSFLHEVTSLVARDDIAHRVRFEGESEGARAVILPNVGMSRARNAVSGDSPEAIASAILNLARN